MSSSVGNLPEGREGADNDAAGRDRREQREPEDEGGVMHDPKRHEQTRGRQKEMYVLMEVDNTSVAVSQLRDDRDISHGDMPEGKVRNRDEMWRREGKGSCTNEKAPNDERHGEQKGPDTLRGSKEKYSGRDRKVGDTKDSAGCRWGVAYVDEKDADSRKKRKTTSNPKKMEKS